MIADGDGPLLSGGGNEWKATQDSYRMEAAGSVAGALALDILLQHPEWKDKPAPQALASLDNQSVVTRLGEKAPEKRPTITSLTRPDTELFLLHESIRARLPKLQTHWVKGHQDKDRKYEDLPHEAQLNVQVDKIAGEFAKTCARDTTLPPNESAKARVYLNGDPVTKREGKTIGDYYRNKDLRQHIQKKQPHWQTHDWKSIDWHNYGRVLRKAKEADRTRYVKFAHNWLPTRKHSNRFDKTVDTRCP